ncbi:MAG: AbrB/MazE/SpoVT family DNA-binding domain-containing protein [Gammaproteobacteria bacterium]|nr:AbrB/MazE/SpoVT family DNA-binding domain-containing protein [Gammaproteobacteria bacterium]MCP5418669.1 AbrB/MazE/SpoVT family DNA-binding domain-containing protein [Chromatiaceae bacterium]
MATATLSSKSQLVLPAEIRKKLGIQPGDRLIVELEGDHAVVRKAPHSDIAALAAYRSTVWRDYADELQGARDEWDR